MCCTPFQKYNKSTALNWRIAYIPCYAQVLNYFNEKNTYKQR